MSATWWPICRLSTLTPDRGACARVGEVDVALFLLSSGSLHAVSPWDPFSGADVITRGIVGTKGEVDVVFSPIYKQAFALATGLCLDDETVRLDVFEVRVRDGVVEVCDRPLVDLSAT